MAMFRKRTYASAFRPTSRLRKRTRFAKRKVTRKGGRRTIDYTSQNTTGHAVGFRGRKTSRRVFQRHIWNSTVFKPHYRSVNTQEISLSTDASSSAGTVQFLNMYKFAGNGFGTVAGGAREIDVGAGVPTFESSSFVLRGGRYTMTIVNQSSSDIKLKMWRITTGNNPDFTIVGASENAAWDPSVTPDFFNQIGKPFMSREVLIEGNENYTFSTRFKTQKIDENAYGLDARSPYICILASSFDGSNAPFKVIQSYNLSFTADAI